MSEYTKEQIEAISKSNGFFVLNSKKDILTQILNKEYQVLELDLLEDNLLHFNDFRQNFHNCEKAINKLTNQKENPYSLYWIYKGLDIDVIFDLLLSVELDSESDCYSEYCFDDFLVFLNKYNVKFQYLYKEHTHTEISYIPNYETLFTIGEIKIFNLSIYDFVSYFEKTRAALKTKDSALIIKELNLRLNF